MKRIAILGSTGSIGQSALAVAAAHPDRLQVVGLSAGENIARFVEQVARFSPDAIAMATPDALDEARAALARAGRPLARTAASGAEGLIAVATHPDADLVLFATSGTAALDAVLAAIAAGKTIALANKEILVMAGAVVMEAARRRGRRRAAGRQRAQRDSPVPPRARGVRGAAPDSHRVGRSVSRSLGRRPARGHARGRAPAPDVANGAEDHHRLRHADEQGARGDRGALAVRRRPRADRRARAPAVDRALDGRARRRIDHRPARRDGHAAAHSVRVLVSGPLGDDAGAARSRAGRPSRLRSPRLRRGSRASGWRSAR